MITDGAVQMEQMLQKEISYCDQNDVKADDDECADGKIGDDGRSETVENLAAIEHAKKE